MPYTIIQIKGLLDPSWSEWLGLSIRHAAEETTYLEGNLQDESQLYSVLTKIRDLQLGLISVQVSDKQFIKEE